jgi:TRAP transporter TAXI family solute receptor
LGEHKTRKEAEKMITFKRMTLCIGLLVFLVSGSGSWAQEPKEKFVKIGTASTGGLWYLTGARLAAEIEKTFPGIKASSTTGSALSNPMKVNSGELQLGLTYTPQARSLYYGTDPHSKGKPHPNLRLLSVNTVAHYTFVVSKNTKIYSFKDLYNARISANPKTYATHIITKWILEHYGITFESIEKAGGMVTGIGYDDATAMIQDKRLDGVSGIPPGPMPHMMRLAEDPGIRILPIEEEMRDKILGDPRFKGWMKTEIPAGAYKGIEKPVPTIGILELFVVNKDVSDELVYKMTKLIYESQSLKDIYKTAVKVGFPPAFDISLASKGFVLPVHPGATRYYKEKGITIPPIEK